MLLWFATASLPAKFDREKGRTLTARKPSLCPWRQDAAPAGKTDSPRRGCGRIGERAATRECIVVGSAGSVPARVLGGKEHTTAVDAIVSQSAHARTQSKARRINLPRSPVEVAAFTARVDYLPAVPRAASIIATST